MVPGAHKMRLAGDVTNLDRNKRPEMISRQVHGWLVAFSPNNRPPYVFPHTPHPTIIATLLSGKKRENLRDGLLIWWIIALNSLSKMACVNPFTVKCTNFVPDLLTVYDFKHCLLVRKSVILEVFWFFSVIPSIWNSLSTQVFSSGAMLFKPTILLMDWFNSMYYNNFIQSGWVVHLLFTGCCRVARWL